MLQTHADNASGQALPGQVDPSTEISLLPAPPPGWVRVPLWASIQSDGPEPLVTCHGILRRSPAGPGWALDPDTVWLWVVKLTPEVLVGGEFPVAVPLFAIPEGWEVIASWSFATGAHAIRTRAVSVDLPAATFDWSGVQRSVYTPRVTTR